MLAHVASAQGVCAVKNALGLEPEIDMNKVPCCVYTIPEIASIGLTEDEASEKYDDVIIGKFPLAASGKAMAMGEVNGSFKVIADKETGKIVGAHLFGANATEIIAEIAAYMKMGGTIHDIGNTIHAHPTVSECVYEAAHDALDECMHLPKMNV